MLLNDLVGFFFLDFFFSFFFKKNEKRKVNLEFFEKIFIYNDNITGVADKLQKKKQSWFFSKLWFIKYNNYIFISLFLFLVGKREAHTTNKKLLGDFKKTTNVFLKKRRSFNLKKKTILSTQLISMCL